MKKSKLKFSDPVWCTPRSLRQAIAGITFLDEHDKMSGKDKRRVHKKLAKKLTKKLAKEKLAKEKLVEEKDHEICIDMDRLCLDMPGDAQMDLIRRLVRTDYQLVFHPWIVAWCEHNHKLVVSTLKSGR